jgi:hypothetical protein
VVALLVVALLVVALLVVALLVVALLREIELFVHILYITFLRVSPYKY